MFYQGGLLPLGARLGLWLGCSEKWGIESRVMAPRMKRFYGYFQLAAKYTPSRSLSLSRSLFYISVSLYSSVSLSECLCLSPSVSPLSLFVSVNSLSLSVYPLFLSVFIFFLSLSLYLSLSPSSKLFIYMAAVFFIPEGNLGRFLNV